MEWVETTGKTVDEANEAALDELGVDETDAEFDVLAEPGIGLFGRLRSEARVRARVRPTAPRAKEDRRDRRRREKAVGTVSQGERTTAGSEPVDDSEVAPPTEAQAPRSDTPPRRSPPRGGRQSPPAPDRTAAESHHNGRREGNQVEVALDE